MHLTFSSISINKLKVMQNAALRTARGYKQYKQKTQHPSHPLHRHTTYFPTLLVIRLPNSEEINHHFSNHTYTKSTPNHIHQHHASFVTPTHTTHISSAAHTYNKREDLTPPLAKVNGVDRQQQQFAYHTPYKCTVVFTTHHIDVHTCLPHTIQM